MCAVVAVICLFKYTPLIKNGSVNSNACRAKWAAVDEYWARSSRRYLSAVDMRVDQVPDDFVKIGSIADVDPCLFADVPAGESL